MRLEVGPEDLVDPNTSIIQGHNKPHAHEDRSGAFSGPLLEERQVQESLWFLMW